MRDLSHVLLVDPDREAALILGEVLRQTSTVEVCIDFVAARSRLLEGSLDMLVTNVRLADFNGLHLVHLVSALGLPTRCIVYSAHHDPLLVREAQSAGAVYETKQRVQFVLASYANANLPPLPSRVVALAIDRLQPLQRSRRHAS